MTLRDELMKMVEAAEKATPGPYTAVANGEQWYLAGHSWLFHGKADAKFAEACSPVRIKALAEVAMAAEATMIGGKGLTQTLAEHSELWAALERLRKAVGQ